MIDGVAVGSMCDVHVHVHVCLQGVMIVLVFAKTAYLLWKQLEDSGDLGLFV